MDLFGHLIILIIAGITTLFFYFSKSDPTTMKDLPFLALAQWTALLGTVLLAISFVLTTRERVFEYMFGGLDKVYKAHHLYAGISFLLLIHHPIFLVLNTVPKVQLAMMYIVPGTNLAYSLGIFAILSMIGIMCLTLFIDLPYHVWKKTHEWTGLVIFLGGLHTMLIRSDVSRYMPLRVWMLGWIMIGVVAFLYIRFIYPLFGKKYAYTVKESKRIGDTLVVALHPVAESMSFFAGQFAFLSVVKKGMSTEEHPFSVMSPPSSPDLLFGIKILGDYTLTLTQLAAGDQVIVRGPYGMFGSSFHRADPAICIAGGIGVTPFCSLLSTHGSRGSNKKIRLFYTVKSSEDGQLLNHAMNSFSPSEQTSISVRDSKKDGRLTAALIAQEIGDDMRRATFYLCGPLPMMESFKKQLRDLGIRNRRILYEDFSVK
jgi:predicted ferric reductase